MEILIQAENMVREYIARTPGTTLVVMGIAVFVVGGALLYWTAKLLHAVARRFPRTVLLMLDLGILASTYALLQSNAERLAPLSTPYPPVTPWLPLIFAGVITMLLGLTMFKLRKRLTAGTTTWFKRRITRRRKNRQAARRTRGQLAATRFVNRCDRQAMQGLRAPDDLSGITGISGRRPARTTSLTTDTAHTTKGAYIRK